MEESVDGCRKGWVEVKKRIKISKLLEFVTEYSYQPTTNRYSGHLRKISTQQLQVQQAFVFAIRKRKK